MGVKNITNITKRDIAQLFREGYIDPSLYWEDSKYSSPDDAKIFYAYCGCLSEVEFLKKIYPLDTMDSADPRYPNAEQEIWAHTVNNYDWECGWVFTDSRFGLTDGDDNIFLTFLCTVFNPEYRNENGYWKLYLDKIQELLRKDGYELYVSRWISGRTVYEWRTLTDTEKTSKIFLPFSERYKKCKLQLPTINNRKRKTLVDLMAQYETNQDIITETGFNTFAPTRKAVVDDIKQYYQPKAYNEQKQYCEEDDFDKLILKSSPQSVFDIIELYSRYNRGQSFANDINELIADIGYQLMDCKMMPAIPQLMVELPSDPDLKDLIQIAETYHSKQGAENVQMALEKIWDAFERVKTHYSTDKKKSVQKIINLIAPANAELYQILDNEFATLTNIGNNYKIRHFENGKLDISDDRIKDYLYNRCLAAINLAIKYIDNK